MLLIYTLIRLLVICKYRDSNMLGNHFRILNARMVQSVESVWTVLYTLINKNKNYWLLIIYFFTLYSFVIINYYSNVCSLINLSKTPFSCATFWPLFDYLKRQQKVAKSWKMLRFKSIFFSKIRLVVVQNVNLKLTEYKFNNEKKRIKLAGFSI